ncbi:MAG TPA: hypothetical protein VF904_14455 [Anaeromyxobacteraceae bacterium]
MTRPALASAVLAAFLAGCGLTADVQVERACARLPQQSFLPAVGVPGLPPGTFTTPPIPFTFGGTIPDMKQKGVTDAQLLFDSLDLTSSANLKFIQTLTLSVLPPTGSAVSKKPIATYTRPTGAEPTTIRATGDGTNLVDYLDAGSFNLEVAVQGDPNQLPTSSWTVDTQLCVDAKATVDYIQAAN